MGIDKISLREYDKLPINDPKLGVVGELFIMNYSEEVELPDVEVELPDVEVGHIIGLMVVKEMTERGHISVHRLFRIV